jgi:hypothetical protein
MSVMVRPRERGRLTYSFQSLLLNTRGEPAGTLKILPRQVRKVDSDPASVPA